MISDDKKAVKLISKNNTQRFFWAEIVFFKYGEILKVWIPDMKEHITLNYSPNLGIYESTHYKVNSDLKDILINKITRR